VPAALIATPAGNDPTATVAVTVLLAMSSTDTLLEPLFVMYANGAARAADMVSKSRPRRAVVNLPRVERNSRIRVVIISPVKMNTLIRAFSKGLSCHWKVGAIAWQ
jgi:hypothetical protein